MIRQLERCHHLCNLHWLACRQHLVPENRCCLAHCALLSHISFMRFWYTITYPVFISVPITQNFLAKSPEVFRASFVVTGKAQEAGFLEALEAWADGVFGEPG